MNRTARLFARSSALALLVLLPVGCSEEAAAPQGEDPQVFEDAGGEEDVASGNNPTPDPDASDTGDIGEDAAAPDAAEVDAAEPDAAEPDAAEPDAAEPDASEACANFAAANPTPAVTVLHALELGVVGGVGPMRYRWAEGGNLSGGILDGAAGLYLAGATGGVVDHLELEDTGCGLTASIDVSVIVPLEVSPPAPDIDSSRTLCFAVEGGSGELAWSLTQKGSGASSAVSAEGCYTAGPVAGEDVVQVDDLRTGGRVEARVRVLQTPMSLSPSTPEVMVALGDTFRVDVRGGSGVYDFAPSGVAVQASAAVDAPGSLEVLGVSPGMTAVRVQDRFYPELSAEVRAHAMLSLEHEPTLWGTHSDDNDVVDVGDVTGDGLPDLMVGLRSSSLNGIHAGAAMLYVGVPGGIAQSPTQVISGSYRYEYLGRSIVAADFDGDGCNDVAVSVWGSDNGGGDRGEVHLYRGCNRAAVPPGVPAPIFEDNYAALPLAPPLVLERAWRGEASGDWFGYALAAGDFNGDGRPDLAISAPRYHVGSVGDAGRVSIFFNRPEGGFSDVADQVIEGQVFDGAAMEVRANLQHGFRMRAGDLNGDGCADLLVGSASGETSDGYAALYLSAPAPQHPSGCELSPQQAVAIAADPTDSRRDARLGWQVALADLNGDCVLDLVVTALQAARLGGSNTAAGAAHIFFGDPAWSAEQPVRFTRGQADVSIVGDDWDQLGSDVSVGDVDGDGIVDLVVSSRYAEDTDTVVDVGEVQLYRGRIDGSTCAGAPEGEAIFEAPARLLNRSDRNGDNFANSLAVVQDRTGDGIAELVILNARGAAGDPSDLDDHRGVVHWLPSEAESWDIEATRDLSIPVALADALFGQAVESIGDINADGYVDFAVGGPYANRAQDQTTYRLPRPYAGVVRVYLGGPEGIASSSRVQLGGHAHHTDYDYFGYDVVAAGDVDGDGFGDLAVSALLEDNTADPCLPCRSGTTSRSDIGAVYIYRGGPGFAAAVAADGELSTFDYVVCGPQISSRNLGRKIQGGFDLDGDGRSDLAFSNSAWSSSRGILWVASTSELSEATPRICIDEAEHLIETGPNTSDVVGRSLAAMDINGDGCDDLLSGADNYDFPGFGGAGTVTVLLGTGRAGCPSEVTRIDLRGEGANDNIGFGLAVLDADGDGVKDLAVASAGAGSANLGTVYLYSGVELRALLAGVSGGAVVVLDGSLPLATLVDPTGVAGNNFGIGLANAGDLDGDGREELLVGSQLARLSTLHGDRTGGAWLYRGSADPIELARPDALLQGESAIQSDSRFGWDVAGAPVSPGGVGGLDGRRALQRAQRRGRGSARRCLCDPPARALTQRSALLGGR
jgi:hypothetical protein